MKRIFPVLAVVLALCTQALAGDAVTPAQGGAVTSPALDALLGNAQGGLVTRTSTGWTNGGAGLAGQVWTSGGPGVNSAWGTIAAPSTPSLAQVLAIGADANKVAITGLRSLTFDTGLGAINHAVGPPDQSLEILGGSGQFVRIDKNGAPANSVSLAVSSGRLFNVDGVYVRTATATAGAFPPAGGIGLETDLCWFTGNGGAATLDTRLRRTAGATLTLDDNAGGAGTLVSANATHATNLTLTGATITGAPTWSSSQAITLSTASQPNVTSVGTLAGLSMTGTLSMSSTPVISGSPACTLGATTVTTLGMGGTLTVGANTLSLASSTVSGTPTWSSNQAITLSTAAQGNVTSLGTLTGLTTSGALQTGVTGTGTGSLVIKGTTSGSTTITVAAAAGSPATWTLPTATAAAGAALTDVSGNGTLSWVVPSAGGGAAKSFFYGDGSDGSQTFDGSTTILGMAPSSSTYTLTKNVYLSSGTINTGVTIITAQYLIFCTGTLTISGTIKNDGTSGSGASKGAGLAQGYFSGGQGGTDGITTASTSQAGGNATATTFGGGGGGGGRSDGTQQSAGTNATPGMFALTYVRTGATLFDGGNTSLATPPGSAILVSGASFSGRGSGDGTNAGGGSAAAGGTICIRAKTITCGASVAIHANGGVGGNGTAGTAGGGGGGAGGLVMIYADTYSGTALSGSNVTANGGNGGTGSTTAGNGSAGGTGHTYILSGS